MSVGVERTAVVPTVIVAIDQHDHRPLVHDPWAARILHRPCRMPVALSRLPVVRHAIRSATDESVPGEWASLLYRKRYIDDLLRNAAQEGLDGVVIVRGGYDTRAYRVTELAGLQIWEAFTYLRKDFVDGAAMCGAEAAYQSFVVKHGLGKYGISPERLDTLLAEYGWRETEQLGSAEYRDRYLRPAGRNHPVSEIERAVCAERLPATVLTDIPARCDITP